MYLKSQNSFLAADYLRLSSEDGDKAETNYITYIDWKDDDGIHYPGEVIQFNIEEVPVEKLTCTIKLGNFSYETSLLSMLEDDKMWP